MMRKNVYFITVVLAVMCFIQTGCRTDYHPFEVADGVVFPVAENFDTQIDGKQVSLYTLENENRFRVDITNYGGRIVSLIVPDLNDIFDDIVTGYHTIEEYLETGEIYFGAIIGRYGNRIGNASFTLDGTEYVLEANNGPNHLHGGPGGFHAVVWDAEQLDAQTLRLTYLSPHMEEGYPGNLETEVIYELNDDNELVIRYSATTDRKTVVNLTNHAFFNLSGEGNTGIGYHQLKINASHFTPVAEDLIPTGEIAPVENTPLDFREFRSIGERIDSDHQQMRYGRGYDHNYVLDRPEGSDELILAASVFDPVSGRKMEVLTTEPGLQFYSGNFLSGNETGKRGEPYGHRTSFCLETQHFPDSPNQPGFPSTELEPGERYESTTVYRFTFADESDYMPLRDATPPF
jgi:aldose 1-epimerase